ncbi:1-phosphatidylinositol 4,5-bisphosphate phosphodiesterase delta-1 [Coemansia sp. BCRC 34301]|nr:1-phosphatidylinositol 4,5-bisphosphate phosphodiesterase delta-1 [Coemansia sp. BCRC 34301]
MRHALDVVVDLERIVEVRVGERALWAVANEDCLPHGAKRLFAIAYYHQMELKTICVVAPSDESYHEWLDTLANLLSSRQPIVSLAHLRRWRLVCIYRQWWETRQSSESATDSFRLVESMVHPAGTAAAPGSHPPLLTKSQPVDDSQIHANFVNGIAPRCSMPLRASARKWLSGGGGTIRPTPSLPLPMTTPPPMLGRAGEFPLLKQQHSSTISLQSSSVQSRNCDESSLDLVDALCQENAQQSIVALYHDISLSLVNFPSLVADTCASQDKVPSLGGSGSDRDNDADDDESDQLTMAGSRGNKGGLGQQRRQRGFPQLRLDMPHARTFGMTLPLFARFLREIQKELVSDAEAKRRFAAFTRPGQDVMTAFELEAYLLSDFNSVECVYSSSNANQSPNMDMPLNQYYVSTSHNTYLVGDQIVGPSKVEAYVRALLRGCRCIEVDCWDGGYGEPVVCHGHTLTTRILFEEVIIAVSHYAFAVSPYPVILSFETHCSLPQQARMATILKKHLGGMLVVAPVGGDEEYELPSPNQLKYRIIIKNKVLDPSSSSSRPSSLIGNMQGGAAASLCNSTGSTQQSQVSSKGISPRVSVAQLKRKIAPELSELIVYCKAVHFEGFEEGSETEFAFDKVTSVSESTSNQQIRQHSKRYIEYNAAQMTRVYPAFSRVTSTNFNPIGHWAAGCQLVALNFQTHDRNMQLYEAMFRRTGDFGYVLKPKHLREPAPRANEDGGDNSESKASPASSSSPSSVSLQSASERSAGMRSPSSMARCTTVHINLLSAYNVVRGGPRRMAAAAAARVSGPLERRSSFVSEAGGISRTSTFLMLDPLSSSPVLLSRSQSDLAMFSLNSEAGAGASSDSDQLQQHLSGGYPSLNAAATAAMESLAAGQQQKHAIAEQQQQNSSTAGSAVRVEIEWITEGAVSGAADSSAESVALLTSTISHLGHQQQLTDAGLTSIQSFGGTAPSSPIANPLGTGYPFHQASSLYGANVAATPMSAAVATFTPAGGGGSAAGRGGRFVSRNGTLAGNSEVRWKDESLFRVLPEPELSFARLSVFEDDVEVASTCISVDALKEGYRFIELGQEEKCRVCRPVYILLHVQVSQLHCLATPPAAQK